MRLHKDGYLEADFMTFIVTGQELIEMARPMQETVLKRQGRTVGESLSPILAHKGMIVEEVRNFQLVPHYGDDYIEVIVDG